MKKSLTLLFTFALAFSLAVPLFAQYEASKDAAPKAETKAKKSHKAKEASAPKERAYAGTIGDSTCGAKHKSAAEHDQKMDARECTLACVKGGGKYVFVSLGKVYAIENQDFAGLEEHAGHRVKLTGTKSADGKSITVSEITMPAAKKAKAS
jgi:hypothetical protein